MGATLTQTTSRKSNPDEALRILRNAYVVIGIPSTKAARSDSPENNAQIGYLQEYGSVIQNIPGRSWLHAPLDEIKEENVAKLKEIATQVLENTSNARTIAKSGLTEVGIQSVANIIRTIDSKIPPPLAQSTIDARLAKRGRSRIKGKYESAIRQGFIERADANAQWFTPLVDTGSFKKAISFVVRGI